MWKKNNNPSQAVVYPCIDAVLHPCFPTKRSDAKGPDTNTTPNSEGCSCFFISTSVWTTAAKSCNLHSNQTCFIQGSAHIHWCTAWEGLYFMSGAWNGSELSHMAQYPGNTCTLAKHHPPQQTCWAAVLAALLGALGFLKYAGLLVERKHLIKKYK